MLVLVRMQFLLIFVFSAFVIVVNCGSPAGNSVNRLLTCYECDFVGENQKFSEHCGKMRNCTLGMSHYCYAHAARDKHDDKLFLSFGCLAVNEENHPIPGSLPLSCSRYGSGPELKTVMDCCKSNFCNNKIPSHLPMARKPPPPSHDSELAAYSDESRFQFTTLSFVLLIVAAVSIALFLFFFLIWRFRQKLGLHHHHHLPGHHHHQQLFRFSSSKHRARRRGDDQRSTLPTSLSVATTPDSHPLLSDPAQTIQTLLLSESGSGSGLPLLMHRTVARTIHRTEKIGQGRFGSVWVGSWRGELVAVKLFESREEEAWKREVDIYNTVMLRHNNILAFYAADNNDNGCATELWLVTEYHRRGSLFDFLQNNTVSLEQAVQFCQTIAAGLSHLHEEINGTHGKPAIAHRDLKSKNILVRDDGGCCIADLGLALKNQSTGDSVELPLNLKTGTSRYMAPEILSDDIDMACFGAFRRADIYSMALVFWEVCRRTEMPGHQVDPYEMPYYDLVPPDPSLADMRAVVYERGARPPLHAHWHRDALMARLCLLVRECWTANPAARHGAMRVKKSLVALRRQAAAAAAAGAGGGGDV